jgi:hypothetical protein
MKSASLLEPLNLEWLKIIKKRSLHHLFPLSWSLRYWFINLQIPLLFLLSLKYKPPNDLHKIILAFFGTILLLCIVGTIFTEFIPIPAIIKLHTFRSSKFFIILGTSYIANYFIEEFQQAKILKKIALYGAATAFFFNVYHLLLPFLLFLLSIEAKSHSKISYSLMMASFIGCIVILLSTVTHSSTLYFLDIGTLKLGWFRLLGFSLSMFAIYILEALKWISSKEKSVVSLFLVLMTMSIVSIYMHSTSDTNANRIRDWKDIQLWSKETLPFDSMIIVPPYLQGFRIYSERSIYVDWKDGGQSIFSVSFALEWKKRMDELRNYSSLREEDFSNISRKSGAKFIVVEKPKKLDFQKLYENKHFIIYEIEDTNR